MESFSIGEIIEQALQTEILGHRFYADMAIKFADNTELAFLFNGLASKELEHKAVFEQLKGLTPDTQMVEGWEEISMYMRAMVESEFFLGKHKSLPLMDHIRSVADAVNFAIGFEKETLLYFMGLRDLISEKSIIDRIIAEESSHIRWLVTFRSGLGR